MLCTVNILLGHIQRNNLKTSCQYLVHKWQRRNLSTSCLAYDKEKDPKDIKPKYEDPKDSEPKSLSEEKHSGYAKQHKNPFQRTLGILSDDLKDYFGYHPKAPDNSGEAIGSSTGRSRERKIWPAHCDVLVIGGGVMGASIAYHIKEQALQGLNVVVVEGDQSYKQASTVLSVGGIRQQFSVEENIELSLYGSEFLRSAHKLLAVEGQEPPDVQFNPHGYLTLASVDGAQQLYDNYKLQVEMRAKVDFLSVDRLKDKYPWLNTDGVEAGVVGLENEGWFDPWSLLLGLRRKAASLGAHFVEGRVTALDGEEQDDLVMEGSYKAPVKNLRYAEVTLPNGEKRSIKFALVVIAAGAWSGDVGRLAGIGEGPGVLSVPIPVEPRKRYVYCVHAPDGPGLDTPLVIDPNGTYFRREGLRGLYLCGQSPTEDQEPPVHNLDVDHDFFEQNIWPTLANRVPSFECLKVHSSWAGYYDYNTFDQNAIVGLHPLVSNLYMTTGFSGHGIQQAAGVGRAIMESIIYGEYQTINLDRLSFDRVILNEPVFEIHIV